MSAVPIEYGREKHTIDLLEKASQRGGINSFKVYVEIAEGCHFHVGGYRFQGKIEARSVQLPPGFNEIFFIRSMMELDWIGERSTDLFHVSGSVAFEDGTSLRASHPNENGIPYRYNWRICWV